MEEFKKSARGQVLMRGALMLVFGLLLNLAITLVGVLASINFFGCWSQQRKTNLLLTSALISLAGCR